MASSSVQNKRKANQSRKNSGRYQNQFLVTDRNKLRRHLKRLARKALWKDKEVVIISARQKRRSSGFRRSAPSITVAPVEQTVAE